MQNIINQKEQNEIQKSQCILQKNIEKKKIWQYNEAPTIKVTKKLLIRHSLAHKPIGINLENYA